MRFEQAYSFVALYFFAFAIERTSTGMSRNGVKKEINPIYTVVCWFMR